LNRPHREDRLPNRGSRERHRRAANGERRHHPIPLTDEGVPAATPDAPKPSPVVFVSGASRERYPWLPPRVIAGSVWRGPEHLRVRVGANGEARPWRCRQAAPR
jgi:hypothetical protein